MLNKLDKEIEIFIDITGSTGVSFQHNAHSLTKSSRLKPMADDEVANIRLFGDWDLKIRFTYNVPDLPLERIPHMLKEG